MEAFKVVALLCSFALVAMVFAANVRADPFDKKTVTTFSEPFEVQGLDAQILPAVALVRTNDEIILTVLDGSYCYRVDWIEVVRPEDTQLLDRTRRDVLTLVAYYPFYYVEPAPRRFIVPGQRISQ